MEISFASPISGIRTAITRENVSANNVANINTNGYEEKRVEQADVQPQGVRAAAISKTPNRATEMSNTDLAEQMKEQLVNKDTLALNVRVAKVQDRMLGTLIDMVG